jgi:hypothetical protein
MRDSSSKFVARRRRALQEYMQAALDSPTHRMLALLVRSATVSGCAALFRYLECSARNHR